jgi:hypothetical protein
MSTPFDKVIKRIASLGYHNHRLEAHSDIVSEGIVKDLLKNCEPFRQDFKSGIIDKWLNARAPGARGRKIDLFIGEPEKGEKVPNVSKLRICVENKSVVTAHRNRGNRFDDLNDTMSVVHDVRQEAIIVATVLVGVARNVLNVPDQIKNRYRGNLVEFENSVLPRLSKGDKTLWADFSWAVSFNSENDPAQTVAKFGMLPTRRPGHTHVRGYDYVLLVPVHIDNVNRPRIARKNAFGIDVEKDYKRMIDAICKAYRARWHL